MKPDTHSKHHDANGLNASIESMVSYVCVSPESPGTPGRLNIEEVWLALGCLNRYCAVGGHLPNGNRANGHVGVNGDRRVERGGRLVAT